MLRDGRQRERERQSSDTSHLPPASQAINTSNSDLDNYNTSRLSVENWAVLVVGLVREMEIIYFSQYFLSNVGVVCPREREGVKLREILGRLVAGRDPINAGQRRQISPERALEREIYSSNYL